MQIAIIGLPNSTKTTIFNALTMRQVETTAYSSGQFEVHSATVDVPDPRVDRLSAMFVPRKTTYAQVTYADIAGLGKGVSEGGLSGPLLNALSQSDALLHVVRAFEDPDVPHSEGEVDPRRDIDILDGELSAVRPDHRGKTYRAPASGLKEGGDKLAKAANEAELVLVRAPPRQLEASSAAARPGPDAGRDENTAQLSAC